jgi:hypothetical protein
LFANQKQREKRANMKQGEKDDANQRRRDARAALTKDDANQKRKDANQKQREKRANKKQGEKDDANQKRRDAHAALSKEKKGDIYRKRKKRVLYLKRK